MGSGNGLADTIDQSSTKQAEEERVSEVLEATPVLLSEEEKKLLLKACKRFRGSIPIYLHSGKLDAQLLDTAIVKLS